MKWMPPEGMGEFLSSSGLCDCENKKIKEKARELTEGTFTPKEAAANVFSYVRDQVQFAIDNFDVKASETLRKGIGFCITKTNLQVALLRAAGIPSRYHRAVLSKSSLKGIIPSIVYRSLPDKMWWHPWCECFISEKWISCDTLLDKSLYDVMCATSIVSRAQIPTIDWDAENDLNTMKHWILEDLGTFHFLDDVFKKVQREILPPKIITAILFRISNGYTSRLRKRGTSL